MPEPRDELLARLLAHLADDPAYALHGATVTDPWGAAQWVKFTDPRTAGSTYLRVVVEPYRPTD